MRSIYLLLTVVFPIDPPTQFELGCIVFCHCHPTDKIRGRTIVFLILRFVFIFSLLKKIYQRKIPQGIKDEKISYSFCDIKLQGEDASCLKKKNHTKKPHKNQLLLQSILGPPRDAAALQVKSNAPSSEPYLLNIKRHFISQTPQGSYTEFILANYLCLLLFSNWARWRRASSCNKGEMDVWSMRLNKNGWKAIQARLEGGHTQC